MRTFVVQLQGGESLRFRAGHLFHGEGVLEVVVWDEAAKDNRSVAVFPLAELRWAYAEDALTEGGSSVAEPG
jgi:hypothetical protein